VLREDECAVDLDLEDAVLALDQARVRSKLSLELGRQPGGTWLVVSNNAVFDRDVHLILLYKENPRFTNIVPRRWNPGFFSCAR